MKKMLLVFLWMVAVCFAASPDQTTANKAIASRVIDEVLSQGKYEVATELYSPEFVNHAGSRDVGLAEDQAAARGWRLAFPDLQMTTELLVAEGNLVAVLWRGKGTNTGEGNGLPVTGKGGESRGITIWRIVDGKITEEWSDFGQLDMLQQMGLVPGAPAAVPDSRSHVYSSAAPGIPNKEREHNRAIARSVFEQIVAQGKLDLFDSIYSQTYVNHGTHRDGTIQEEIEGTRGLRQFSSDLKVTVEQTIAEGDLVTVLYALEGTNTGAALGLPATGKHFRVRGISILRVNHGRITDEWSMLDRYPALVQLGLLPAPDAQQTQNAQ